MEETVEIVKQSLKHYYKNKSLKITNYTTCLTVTSEDITVDCLNRNNRRACVVSIFKGKRYFKEILKDFNVDSH